MLTIGQYKADFIPLNFSFPLQETPSGNVTLDENGDRLGTYVIYNIRRRLVAPIVGTISEQNYIENDFIAYPGFTLSAPMDQIAPSPAYLEAGRDLGALIIFLFVVSLLFITIALAGLIYYRKTDMIRYAGLLWNIIIITCLTVAIFDMVLYLDVPTDSKCRAMPLLAPASLSTVYGLILLKGILVYQKFYKFEVIERYGALRFRESSLGLCFVIPNILIWIIWIAVDPPAPSTVKLGPGEYQMICSYGKVGIGQYLMYIQLAYNGLIILFNLVSSFKCRLINLNYNELKMIRYSVFSITVIYAIVVVVLQIDSASIQTYALFRAIGMFYLVCMNCVVLFYHKFYFIREQRVDPKINSDTKRPVTLGYKIPKEILNSYDRIEPAIAFIKKSGGISNLFNEPIKMLLIAGSPSFVWGCTVGPEISPGTCCIKEVGEIWQYTQLCSISVTESSSKCRYLDIGKLRFQLVFEKEGACEIWTRYFKQWITNKPQGFGVEVVSSKELDRLHSSDTSTHQL